VIGEKYANYPDYTQIICCNKFKHHVIHISYFDFQLSDVCSMILERGWTVGLLMKHIEDYCRCAIMEMEENGSLTTALFEYLQQQM
jgi:hypothetical protein